MGKIAAAVAGLVALLILLAAAGAGSLLSGFGGGTQLPSYTALTDIPPDYLILYREAAATCPGLPWSVLAAIGKIETDSPGAEGPMQFLLPTFTAVVRRTPPPPGGATPPSPYNPHDAIYAAAAYLCESGARDGKDIPGAIKTYNHADWYVAEVLTQAQAYVSADGLGAETAPGAAALEAINYTEGQLGLPYEWGGDGPAAGDAGFDCSGLTKAAYAAAGITLPRVAQAQYDAGPHVPAGQALEPGDLVFYGTRTDIHHVGLYIGGGQMIDAPRPGKPVRIEPYRYAGDDYAGATRLAS